MLKSTLAIIVSYVVIFVLFMAIFTGLYFMLGVERVFQPDSYEFSTLWLVLTVLGSFFGWLLGGWLCVAISKSLRTGQVFALIIFIATLVSCISSWNRGIEGPNVRAGEIGYFDAFGRGVMPRWFHLANPIVALAGAMIGVRLRRVPAEAESFNSMPLSIGGCAMVGVIFGIPASYWFQPGALRIFVSLPDYITKFPDLISTTEGAGSGAKTIAFTLVCTMIAGAVIGGVAGYFLYERQVRARR